MRNVAIPAFALLLLAGCGGWGDYVHKSDRFGYKITFPDGWEVFDRSDEQSDFLSVTKPDLVDAEITVRAYSVAPDLHPNEVYPTLLSGAEYSDRLEFKIEDKGVMSCKNAEGRFIKFEYLGEEYQMRGMKVIFLGMRVMINVSVEMKDDDFILNEGDILTMFHRMEI